MAELERKERTAAQAYLEVAAAHGVEYVFGLPGTSGQEFIGTIARGSKRGRVEDRLRSLG